jgi:histidyl-tRNA synthetase
MYSFEDRGGDWLSLRPEGTAGVVRAVIQNGMLYASPQRLWYMGPMFRRERPQKGRTRQFHQIGVEVFGAFGPDIDAEILAMCSNIWQATGLKNLRLEINSLGTAEERAVYRNKLYSYFSGKPDELDEDSKLRLDRNPMRILDSKNPALKELISKAPILQDELGNESRQHFEQLQTYLDALGVKFVINSRLVRGLDYYSHTVFEWITDELGAQGTVCAGGRYNGLVELQGGKSWPGIGFAMGQERLVELMRSVETLSNNKLDIYMVTVGESTTRQGLVLAQELRNAVPDLSVQSNLGGGSFKAQFKRADRSGASLALILGEEELKNNQVSVKPLRTEAEQQSISMENLQDWLINWKQQDRNS